MKEAKLTCAEYPNCKQYCPCEKFVDVSLVNKRCRNNCAWKHTKDGIECNRTVCPCDSYERKF